MCSIEFFAVLVELPYLIPSYLDKFEEAIGCYKKAISIDPENYNGYFQLGFGLHQLNKYQEAIKAYKFGLFEEY